LVNLLTRSPGDVAKEQIKKLYLRLYPYIIGDFSHKDDLKLAFESINLELQEIKIMLQAHIHPVEGLVASPTALPIPPVTPSVVPSDVIARSLEIPGGVPQPTGAGVSIQRSRIDNDPIAIPPINPLDPGV